MDFVTSWASIAAVGTAAGALLIGLYLLKLRRRPVAVPSTLLWRRAVEDLAVNSLIQRLRSNLLLILQALLVLLLVAAFARPRLADAAGVVPGRFIVLVDRSASMMATDVSPTRFERARELAATWLAGIPDGSEVMLVAFAGSAEVIASYTSDLAEIRSALARLEPLPESTCIANALQLARAQSGMEGRAAARVAIFSDGILTDADRADLTSLEVEFYRVGAAAADADITPIPSVAVLDVGARRGYENPLQVHAQAALANFGPEPLTLTVALADQTGRIRSARTVDLPAFANAPADDPARLQAARLAAIRTIDFTAFEDPEEQVLTLRISGLEPAHDRLALDNTAHAVLPALRRPTVLLVTDGNPLFLLRALRNPALRLDGLGRMTTAQWQAEGIPRDPATGRALHDVVVFEAVQLDLDRDALPQGSYIVMGGQVRGAGFEPLATRIEADALTAWDPGEPLLAFLDLADVVIWDVPATKLAPGTRVLVSGEQGPAIYEWTQARRRVLMLSFEQWKTDWWTRPSWQMFWMNALATYSQTAALAERSVVAGQAIALPVRTGQEGRDLRLISPSGREISPAAVHGDEAVFTQTSELGVYRVQGQAVGTRHVAVRLGEAAESDLTYRGEMEAAAAGSSQFTALENVNRFLEIWPWVAAAAIVLLLVEWIYSTRRLGA